MTGSNRGVALAWLTVSLLCSCAVAHAQEAGPQPPAPKAASAKKSAKAARAVKPVAPEPGKQDGATAQSHVEDGIKALEAGKADAAVASLTSALSGGALPAPQTARALYYRGLAYRKVGKPALAIADLTSALWLKNGLNEQQRSDAMQNRAGAYREAGLPDQSEADYVRSAPAPLAQASQTPTGSKQPVAQPASSSNSSSSGLGGLFGSLFGAPSAPSAPPADARPQATASAVSTPWSTTTAIPAISARSDPVTVASLPTPPPPAHNAGPRSAAGAATVAALPQSSPGGQYRVQVAAVRTNDEALGIAAQLQDRYASVLGNRSANVDQTVVGNIGAVYRVRIGPFGNANESRVMCDRLKKDGYDCMVVTAAQ